MSNAAAIDKCIEIRDSNPLSVRLKQLDLRAIGSSTALSALAARGMTRVDMLECTSYDDDIGTNALLPLLTCPSLRVLQISTAIVGSQVLARALAERDALETLMVCDTTCWDPFVIELQQWLRHTTSLRRLVFDGLRTRSPEAFDKIFESVAECSSLCELSLWRTHLGEEVAHRFAAKLASSPSSNLETVGLWACELRDESVAALLGAVQRSSALRRLDFSTGQFSIAAVVQQITSILLTCTQLTFLRLSGFMSDAPQAFTSIFEAASQCTNLCDLHIATSRAFDLPPAGAAAIESVIANCQSLRVLQCGGAVVSLKTFDSFLDVLEASNTSLTLLYWGTMFATNDNDDHLRDRRERLLRRNLTARWSCAHAMVATIAIGMASLDLPAYVVLEIVDQIEGLCIARHGFKIRALILVKNRFRLKHLVE